MLRRRLLQLVAAAPGLAAASTVRAQAAPAAGSVVVLTALQATYSMASALAAGTRIVVRNTPPKGAPMEAQARSFARMDDSVFVPAAAVIGIGKLWVEDPLYPAARARNIQVINIDAAFPWDGEDSGVSLIERPSDDAAWINPARPADRQPAGRYIWLGIPNGIRMAELIAADFERLSPPDAARIRTNLSGFSETLRSLKAEYESRFSTLETVQVFSLADEFVYLFADMGVFVDGSFVRQDLAWTAADLAGLTAHLKSHELKIVVHKWTPDDRILAAIAAAGAKLVVLSTGDTEDPTPLAADGYQALLRSNLETLAKSLA